MAQPPIIIAKNVSASPQKFLGTVIQPNSESQISDHYFQNQITRSDALRALITSGDIVINNGIANLDPTEANALCSYPYSMLNATTHTISATSLIETEAIKITTGAGANKILTSDAVGDATWEDPSGGSRAAVQVRLTSNENLPGSLTDIEFDTIDIESDDSIIEVISDERIRVLQAGYYVVTFQGVFNPNDGSERELDIEIRKNGVLIPGGLNMTLFDESSKEDWTQISMEVIGLFAINDEISTAYEDSSGNIEIRANASMIVKTL